MRIVSFIAFLSFCAVASVSVPAQTSCGSNGAILDVLLSRAKSGDKVVAIARLGLLESDESLSKRRLHNLNAYLTRYRPNTVFSKQPENLILITGRKTQGLGTVEIYFQQTFFTEFIVSTDLDLFVGECAVDLELHKNVCELKEQRIFYPCIESCKNERPEN